MIIGDREVQVVGDKILVAPEKGESLTKTGLYLPANAVEAKTAQTGRVLEVGPGIPILRGEGGSQPWKEDSEEPSYLPLQARKGDVAVYLKEQGVEVHLDGKTYVIVPHNAVLALVRPSLDRVASE